MTAQIQKPESKSQLSALHQQGFTLIEVIIGLVIGTLGMLLFSSGVVATLSSSDFVKETSTRDELSFSIRNTILNRKALKFTTENNLVMRAVLLGEYNPPFKKVFSNTDYGITLYDGTGVAISGPGVDYQTPTPSPMYYTLDGFPCTTPGTHNCTLAVTTTFAMQTIAKWIKDGTNNVVPHISYPLKDTSVKPDFFQISYNIEYVGPGDQIQRKPASGTIFMSVEDLGELK